MVSEAVKGLTDDELAALDAPTAVRGLTDEDLQALPAKQAPRKAPIDMTARWYDDILARAPDWMQFGNRAMRGIAQGAADPMVGAAQMAMKAVGAKGGLEAIKQQESDYAAQAGDGFDGWRLGGNLISPAAVLTGAGVGPAATLTGRVAQGAGLGGMFGLTSPGDTDRPDYWGGQAEKGLMGTLFGGAVPAAMSGAARMVAPRTQAPVQALNAEGIPTTVGQTLGGVFKTLEDKSMSIPLVGDAIEFARRAGVDAFNRATYNRVLGELDETMPRGIKAGHEALKYVHDRVNKAYDRMFNNVHLEARPQQALPPPGAAARPPMGSYLDDLSNLRQLIDHIPDSYKAEYDQTLNKVLTARATPQGNLSGTSLNDALKDLRGVTEKLANTQDVWGQKLRDAYRETSSILLDALERQNPGMADEIRSARSAWHQYAIVRDAAARQGASKEGVFTPAQLQGSVAETAKKLHGRAAGRGQISEGRATMQDLANNGARVLPSTYPDSGTVGRGIHVGLLGGALAVEPTVATGLGIGALPYVPGLRNLMQTMLTRRPAGAEKVAGALRRVGPMLAPALAPGADVVEQ